MDKEKFQQQTQAIPIPEALDSVLFNAIERGQNTMKRKRTVSRGLKTLVSLAAAIALLAVSIQVSPALAQRVEQLPGGAGLVALLRADRPWAQGGAITDGQDIRDIDRTIQTDPEDPASQGEILRITLGEDGTLAHYEVLYTQYPYSVVITLNGVRAFSAMDALKALEEGPLIKGAYPLITLDDSAHRLVIVFTKPVHIHVAEAEDAPALILTIREDTETAAGGALYALRTPSMEFGELLGILETDLRFEFGSSQVRILQDQAGTYLVEEGLYDSANAAEARRTDLLEMGFPYELVVEGRGPADIPEKT
jgi:hypothetical protein